MSTHGGFDAYPVDYLAEDDSQKLINASIVVILVITIVYAMFLASRFFFAECNHWEIWVLYPLSYLVCLGLCITGVCKFIETDILVPHEFSGRLLCADSSSQVYAKVPVAGPCMAYWLVNDQSVILPFLKIRTAGEFVYMAGVTLPKVAILILYLRIFVERKLRIITWVVIGVALCHWVANGIIAALAACHAFAFKWDKTIQDGHCANLLALYTYVSIPNILTDLAIGILPISTLYHLKMSRIRKIGVSLTLLAGSL